ncbi:MAG: hypothetical protein IJT83_03625, partial [Victivallales bacterium]|nr:hypothetical protein [Victivallales bacterium]
MSQSKNRAFIDDRANCIDKRYLQTGGDNATLRYFGMTDCIPWLNSERQLMGQAVNFYYSMLDKLPAGDDPQIIAMAPSLWDASEADKQWKSMERWRKWSSINSGDSFKEKAFVFSSSPIT